MCVVDGDAERINALLAEGAPALADEALTWSAEVADVFIGVQSPYLRVVLEHVPAASLPVEAREVGGPQGL